MSLRILLVEDSPFDAKIAKAHLEGFALVDWQRTLTAALSSAKLNIYDAAILNLYLPDSRGEDTVRAFTNLPHPMPLLVLLGDLREMGDYSEWVDTSLPKPVDKRQLLDALKRITDRTSHHYLKQSTQRIFESLELLKQMAHG
jgi:DNA-binding response OmpR family regulator